MLMWCNVVYTVCQFFSTPLSLHVKKKKKKEEEKFEKKNYFIFWLIAIFYVLKGQKIE